MDTIRQALMGCRRSGVRRQSEMPLTLIVIDEIQQQYLRTTSNCCWRWKMRSSGSRSDLKVGCWSSQRANLHSTANETLAFAFKTDSRFKVQLQSRDVETVGAAGGSQKEPAEDA